MTNLISTAVQSQSVAHVGSSAVLGVMGLDAMIDIIMLCVLGLGILACLWFLLTPRGFFLGKIPKYKESSKKQDNLDKYSN
jgi:GrpB-like predicted nucleotidyltransferase (UPF0157 family)